MVPILFDVPEPLPDSSGLDPVVYVIIAAVLVIAILLLVWLLRRARRR